MEPTLQPINDLIRAGAQPKSPQPALASKEMFLKLLVAQMRNQNPLKPLDGTEFVTQLAQFTGLEQMIAMREQLEAIHQAVTELAVQPEPSDTSAAPQSTNP